MGERKTEDEDEAVDVGDARAGDRAAFARLVARHDRALLELATRLLGDVRDGEDARQAAWLKIWLALPSFDEQSSFRTWSWRIVVNTCRDGRRAAARRVQPASGHEPAPALIAHAPSPDVATAASEEAALVRAALAELPDEERECLVLRHWHGLAPQEIAAVVARPRTTVQSCLARALTRLQLKLRPRLARDDDRRSRDTNGGMR